MAKTMEERSSEKAFGFTCPLSGLSRCLWNRWRCGGRQRTTSETSRFSRSLWSLGLAGDGLSAMRTGTNATGAQVRAWDPPRLVTFSWHLGPDWKFDPDLAKASDVAIRFTSEGASATLVELEHSGIERHGEGYEQLRVMLDSPDAWTTTLDEFAKAADREVRG